MRELTEERREFYENVMNTCKADYEAINNEIEVLIAEARERVNDLNAERKSVLMVYDGTCQRLGVENEFEMADDAGAKAE